jgi:imidazolonepropionase-like amidohydrolase
MRIRVSLTSPFGDPVTRDIEDDVWADPVGTAGQHIGRDTWALPGLSDSHSHLAGEELTDPGDVDGAIQRSKEALEAGVTLLIDKGWRDTTAIEALNRMQAVERPDVEAAAEIISVEGGYFPGFGRVVAPDEISVAVTAEARRGRGWVKLVGDWPRRGVGPVPNFNESQLREAVSAAERLGSKVAVHTMARDVPSLAVRAGVHSIEHGLFLLEADLATLGERGGMWVPTIRRMEETIAQLGRDSSGGRLLHEGLENVRRLLPRATGAGVSVLAGTDLVGAPSDVAAEALKLAEFGLTNREAVAAVGLSAFSATGRPTGFEVGSPANAVLFPADPIEDLNVLQHPSTIIRLGSIL